MKQVLTIISLFTLLTDCKNTALEPGEVAATITGYVIADNWAKYCSSGGLEIKTENAVYFSSTSIAAAYEDPNAWPISVWIRYQPDAPDTCTQSTNRIKILSIRKR